MQAAYHNPAGLKFVTRVEIDSTQDLWPDGLAYLEDKLIMNIPNGAGPGTVLLQTDNAYAEWRVVGTKNLVRSTQRAYTGAASWEEVWVEDGCFIYCRVQDVTEFLFNVDGLQPFPNPPAGGAASIKTLWFPNGARIPTFDRLSLVSGNLTPAQPGGFPFRQVANNGIVELAPPGLCRYFQISSDGAYDYQIQREGNIIWESVAGATTYSYGFCPAWGNLLVTNTSGGAANIAICWNRFPMTGS